MKLGSVTKLDNRNSISLKILTMAFIPANCDVIVIFLIYGQFGVIRKADSAGIVW